MPTYQTPGVYIEEISILPSSVAEGSTAIPAFLGYTEKGFGPEGPTIERVKTLLEYVQKFGGATPHSFSVTVRTGEEGDARFSIQQTGGGFDYILYDAVEAAPVAC